jgi:hypothetical protein
MLGCDSMAILAATIPMSECMEQVVEAVVAIQQPQQAFKQQDKPLTMLGALVWAL